MPMKTTNIVTRFAMAILLLGILVYFGAAVYQSFSVGLTTVLAYEESVDVGAQAFGLVIREERVLTAASPGASTVEFAPSEGEKVSGGGVVATIYTTSSGLETKQAITTLEAELEQLEYARVSSAGATDATKTENDLLSAIAGLHASACAGNLTGLERDVLNLRTLVFKRDFTYGGASQELSELIDRKTAQLAALRSSLGAVSTVIRTPQSGVFSSVVDGFEDLTPALLDDLTAAQLTQLEGRQNNPPADAIGKVITSSTWYFAAVTPSGDAKSLREGIQYTISFTRDFSGKIPMTLERISGNADGDTLLVFSCRTHLAQATQLRKQTANVVTQRITGIRVPRSALRALQQTVKRQVVNENTGETQTIEEEVTVTGVYTVPSRQAEFTPVNVLYQGDDFFLVEPADDATKDRLRVGDEIIVYTAGITDGKVVR